MNSKKSKVWEKNLYELLELTITATESDIKTAYRKTALKCHPDKNPDDPKAADRFLELSEALEILTDPKAKELYDRTLKGKALAKERTRVLDSKRRQLKEDLERREQAAKEASKSFKTTSSTSSQENDYAFDEEMLRKEVERLKKEGSKALREEQELIRQQIIREQQDKLSFLQGNSENTEGIRPKFKIKWSSSIILDQPKLKNIFEKYGELSNLVVIKRSALVEFMSLDAAERAFNVESTKQEYQWKFEWVSKPEHKDHKASKRFPSTPVSAPNINTNRSTAALPTPGGFADFEAMILGQLSAAAEAQKNTSQNSNSTGDGQ